MSDIRPLKLLIIGNGFDLAHGLPTSYEHFLKFCIFYRKIIQYDNSPQIKANFKNDLLSDTILIDMIKDLLMDEYENRRVNKEGGIGPHKYDFGGSINNRLAEIINDNVWISYFFYIYEDGLIRGKNWIDCHHPHNKETTQKQIIGTDRG